MLAELFQAVVCPCYRASEISALLAFHCWGAGDARGYDGVLSVNGDSTKDGSCTIRTYLVAIDIE